MGCSLCQKLEGLLSEAQVKINELKKYITNLSIQLEENFKVNSALDRTQSELDKRIKDLQDLLHEETAKRKATHRRLKEEQTKRESAKENMLKYRFDLKQVEGQLETTLQELEQEKANTKAAEEKLHQSKRDCLYLEKQLARQEALNRQLNNKSYDAESDPTSRMNSSEERKENSAEYKQRIFAEINSKDQPSEASSQFIVDASLPMIKKEVRSSECFELGRTALRALSLKAMKGFIEAVPPVPAKHPKKEASSLEAIEQEEDLAQNLEPPQLVPPEARNMIQNLPSDEAGAGHEVPPDVPPSEANEAPLESDCDQSHYSVQQAKEDRKEQVSGSPGGEEEMMMSERQTEQNSEDEVEAY